MGSDRSDWLEALPYPALLVGGDGTILAANSLSPALPKKLSEALPADHPLLAALPRVLAQHQHLRLSELALPNLPRCDVHVTAGPDAAALVILEMRDAVPETYTDLSAELAAMLAHEIRNPLLSIRGAAQLLAGSAGPEDKPLASLIINEVARIDQLIATLDPLSITPPQALEPLNLHEVVEHARMAALAAFGPGIHYVKQYDPSLPPIRANRDALVQALANVLKNAAEAVEMIAEPRITLTTRYAMGEARRNENGQALPIAISVADNGNGVPPRLEERLFAPFVTTKVNGKGLGLSIVARIVEEHGGQIVHDRPKEGGARFTLYLPAAA